MMYLYYYYFLKNGDNPDISFHSYLSMTLTRGQIIEDYFYNNEQLSNLEKEVFALENKIQEKH